MLQIPHFAEKETTHWVVSFRVVVTKKATAFVNDHMDYSLISNGYFSSADELRERGLNKSRKQLREEEYNKKTAQAGGVQFAVRQGMTEQERYDELKDRRIVARPDEASAKYKGAIDTLTLIPRAKGLAEKVLIPLAEELNILNRAMKTPEVDIDFVFSKNGGLAESMYRQLQYGGEYADFAKALINIDSILENAVLIEQHGDKYRGTEREDPTLENVSVLLGAFRDVGYVIPVQFEIKKSSTYGGRLYMTVALTKIRADVLGRTSDTESRDSILISASEYSIADIFREIKPEDARFLKYVPDGFLSDEQIAAKEKAIATDQAKVAKLKPKAQRSSRNYDGTAVLADPATISPINEITDQGKYDYLVEDYRKNGYQGRPIVAVGSEEDSVALTGSHRILAAREAGIDIPVVFIPYNYDSDRIRELLDAARDDDRLAVAKEMLDAGEISQEAYDLIAREEDLNYENYEVPYEDQIRFSVRDNGTEKETAQTGGVQMSSRNGRRDYNPIREQLAKQGLDDLSKRLGDRFPLSAQFESTIKADHTPLSPPDVTVNGEAKAPGESKWQAAKRVYQHYYGTGTTKVRLGSLGIDADMTYDFVDESMAKVPRSEVQIMLDLIPQMKAALESGELLGIERVHIDNPHVPIYGYRIYNAYNYNTLDGDGNVTSSEKRIVVATVVQSLDNAHAYVFRDIKSASIGGGSSTSGSSVYTPGSTIQSVSQLYDAVKKISRSDGGLKYETQTEKDMLFHYTHRNDGTQYSVRDNGVSDRDLLLEASEDSMSAAEQKEGFACIFSARTQKKQRDSPVFALAHAHATGMCGHDSNPSSN